MGMKDHMAGGGADPVRIAVPHVTLVVQTFTDHPLPLPSPASYRPNHPLNV